MSLSLAIPHRRGKKPPNCMMRLLIHRIISILQSKPKVYPVNEQGEWEPHWVFIGEIKDVKES